MFGRENTTAIFIDIQGHVHEAYVLLTDQVDSDTMQWDFIRRLVITSFSGITKLLLLLL